MSITPPPREGHPVWQHLSNEGHKQGGPGMLALGKVWSKEGGGGVFGIGGVASGCYEFRKG